jgi:hypothetical protein
MNNDVKLRGAQAWKELYRAAVLEANMDIVPQRGREARKAARERAIQLIRETADCELELSDLAYASRVLDELNSKCQSVRCPRPRQSTPEDQVGITQEQTS